MKWPLPNPVFVPGFKNVCIRVAELTAPFICGWCAHSMDWDRKEADLACLFKSSLTVAEELPSDLHCPRPQAWSYTMKRWSLLPLVSQQDPVWFVLICGSWFSCKTLHVHFHHERKHTVTKNPLLLCVLKKLNYLDDTRAHPSSWVTESSHFQVHSEPQVGL